MEFEFHMPTQIRFGSQKAREVGQVMRSFGARRLMLVTDRGVLDAGLTDGAVQALKASGIESVTIYSDIEPDPSVQTVNRAAAAFLEGECDSIVAIGGGSPIDAAKGIRVVAAGGGSISDYNGVGLVKGTGGIPLAAIPTTAGTGSEVTMFGVYTDVENEVKITVTSSRMSPDVSFVDPELTMTCPRPITSASGIDSLAHAVEAMFSTRAVPASDGLAAEAIRLIASSLKPACETGGRAARTSMSHGSLLAGMAFNIAHLGMTHAISSALSGKCHVSHGVAIGLLLPTVVAFNAKASPERAAKIASLLGIEGGSDEERIRRLGPFLTELAAEIGLPTRLNQVGVKREQLPDIARDTFKSRMLQYNPIQPTVREVSDLLEGLYQ
ncbi:MULTISPECIES: iron-containing alcohol dehydrogenase family protein [Cohnella]|uniref:iron-containing alcohol dehydrogenase family protein n=1 Tax=Cohnella TaxID=329857 RepID=UPI0009BB162E|nr:MULTISPECIES: iron-containing alcohol dehydrogenase [Cohnella]MBN2981374.1 iron-containing alcohol dehydrogenase [Cohnella algarum]